MSGLGVGGGFASVMFVEMQAAARIQSVWMVDVILIAFFEVVLSLH